MAARRGRSNSSPADRTTAIRQEAERIHETAKLASETQFEFAKRWRRADRVIGTASATLAAVAGVGGLSQFLSARWAGFVAVLAAGAGAVSASIGARQSKEKASVAANAYRGLQQDLRVFLEIDLDAMDVGNARERLQQLIARSQQLNREAEIPSPKAWAKAKEQIEGGSQNYEADGAS